ncbi:PD-(D/E)XK nuclease family protein [Chloroflexota bacterium]
MQRDEADNLWHVVTPKNWPSLPTTISATLLNKLEVCPRQWALVNAGYPELWNREGYPPRMHIANLKGSTIHLAIEKVTREFTKAGCSSVQDSNAIEVMRGLGGFTQIVEDSLDRVLGQYQDNPRVAHSLSSVVISVRSQIPEMRSKLQSLLRRVRLQSGSIEERVHTNTYWAQKPRIALGIGAHPETNICASDLGWHGRADLITISNLGCEITDFKTGKQSEHHEFQMLFYSLLWYRDNELNPTAQPATKLTISYIDRDIDVPPPSIDELLIMEEDISMRIQNISKALSTNPPQARPDVESCTYCDVRHLCDKYWEISTQTNLATNPSLQKGYIDMELCLVDRHGPTSWNTTVNTCPRLQSNRELVLRMPPGHYAFRFIENAQRIRILNAYLIYEDHDDPEPVVATVNAVSEVFAVN